MGNDLVEFHLGSVEVPAEIKAKFKYLCTKEGIYVRDKIVQMIKDEVKDVKVE